MKTYLLFALLLGEMVSAKNSSQSTLKRLIQTPGLEHASIGVSIVRINDGKTMIDYQSQMALAPASTQKTITTATALRMLGPNFRFATEIGYTGKILSDGVLDGDLIIRGSGDPTIGSRYSQKPSAAFFQQIAEALAKNGIKRVNGRIIADDTALDTEAVPSGWTWEDMGNYYAAGVYGINYGDNLYELVLDTSHKGQQPTLIKTFPDIPGLEICNQLLAKSVASDSAYLYGAPYTSVRYLYGAVPQKSATFSVKGDVPDPAYLTSSLIERFFKSKGIAVSGYTTGYQLLNKGEKVPHMQKCLTVYYSDPLSSIVKQTNHHSWNLFAEALLRAIAVQKGNGKTADGIELVKKYWSEKQHIETSGLFLHDGSGLSPSNRVTAAFMTRMLRAMSADDVFVNSLPMAGKEGTVKGFLINTSLAGKARLKSGYIKQVIAYTGYIDSKNGRFAVAILINNANSSNKSTRMAIQQFLLAQDW